jgi:hypothetical protein
LTGPLEQRRGVIGWVAASVTSGNSPPNLDVYGVTSGEVIESWLLDNYDAATAAEGGTG